MKGWTWLLWSLLAGCDLGEVGPDIAVSTLETSGTPNVVVVTLDGVGDDLVAFGGAAEGAARTPTLDRLAAEGVWFENAVSQPSSGSTQAALLTGRFGRRTGFGEDLGEDDDFELPLGEETLAERTEALGYRWHAVGSWLLAGPGSPSGGAHPRLQGFKSWQGVPGPVVDPDGFFRFTKVHEDGLVSVVEKYLTTDEIDDAVRMVRSTAPPFGLWLSLHAGSGPLHLPPAELQSAATTGDEPDGVLLRAAVEAADAELERLLSVLPDGTWVFVMGTHGASDEGGLMGDSAVGVPLLVWGPAVASPGRAVMTPVQTVDVFATVLDLASGSGRAGDDGASFASLLADPEATTEREVAYTEAFGPNGPAPYGLDARSVRDLRWRYVRDDESAESLYEVGQPGVDLLEGDPGEEALAASARLGAELDRWTAILGERP